VKNSKKNIFWASKKLIESEIPRVGHQSWLTRETFLHQWPQFNIKVSRTQKLFSTSVCVIFMPNMLLFTYNIFWANWQQLSCFDIVIWKSIFCPEMDKIYFFKANWLASTKVACNIFSHGYIVSAMVNGITAETNSVTFSKIFFFSKLSCRDNNCCTENHGL
jgi:hypothetical protein